MKSGMLAAEAAFEALLKGDSSEQYYPYKAKVNESWIRKEMEISRNFLSDITNKGLVVSGINYGIASSLVLHPISPKGMKIMKV